MNRRAELVIPDAADISIRITLEMSIKECWELEQDLSCLVDTKAGAWSTRSLLVELRELRSNAEAAISNLKFEITGAGSAGETNAKIQE